MAELELWGGAECTVVRVGDRWGDQSHLSGHHGRDEDLDLFADVGFKAMRYPVLWERVAPNHPDECDWSWSDARLARLRDLGIRPIAGLVHHGSGPHYTSLLDPEFPAKLGRYAGQVARRYPWIEDWTPVNEPLTTARFSCLYGHWYPHHRDEGSFWTALVNQVDGVAHAMRAIREVIPHARLIQTDDLGRTYATAPLFHQAAFDNTRRWAGWDLLCGRVTPDHPLWRRLVEFGLEDRLRALADAPCPPDIVGINHYLTSDRFLDHRVQRYPEHVIGGNFEQRYADVEAIRVLDPAPGGLAGALREAWERYRTPVAVTEVHLGCTREEQLRWVGEVWDTAAALREEGVDVRGVTAWAVLGSCGWNTLLTCEGVYEAGLYDVGAGTPRPTALAHLWKGLPDGAARHPVATTPGWWRRPMRLLHPPVPRPARFERGAPALPRAADVAPLLICGATGTLGRAFARACDVRDIPYVLTDLAGAAACADRHRPWAMVDVEATRGRRTSAAKLRGLRTLHVSDELDGSPERLVVRAAGMFGGDGDDFATEVARALEAGRRFRAAGDRLVTPAYLPALVNAALDLLIDDATGVWRLRHGPALGAADFARAVARACGLDPTLVDGAGGGAAADPPAAEHELLLAPLDEALAAFAADRRRAEQAAREAA
ncbi:family 1 glycosylhydrolase [Sphingomonas lenta]|uniref:dTDP-4-dehydrorhamnose reductase n=1 Tax=Sphingomonas lenta TaxID=1141887 RepID=A0A2A2SDU8_9SPHN|nr:family 1 glycosylhydrolase [Sphingomonas lenta]PAX07427.1 dTDP-4-dehydrorhamnose reductase [Sphingomonas lenta]